MALLTQRRGILFHCLLHIGAARQMGNDFAAQQIIQQDIPGALIVFAKVGNAFFQQHFCGQPKFRRSGNGLAHMVRLGRPLGNDHIGFFLQRIGQQKFQLTGFIAAAGKPCRIIALDPYFRTAE